MMDISMYGNHHTSHTSGFQSPDIGSGGYPYFSAGPHHHHHHHHQMHSQNAASAAYASQVIPNNSPVIATNAIQSASNNSNHLYSAAATHPHLYSPTAIEYGIHTSSSNNSPSEQYFEHGEGGGYYNTGNGSSGNGNNNNNGSPMPENHIISSDNGLSYTNLDYIAYQQAHGNQAYLHGADEKVHLAHHYNEEMIMASGQHHHGAGNNPWHHAHSHGYAVESSGNLANQLNITAMPGGNLTSQQQISHSMHSPSGIQPAQSASPTLQNQQQQQQSQQQQNVPQYKWMQVKRNVPKPQSK